MVLSLHAAEVMEHAVLTPVPRDWPDGAASDTTGSDQVFRVRDS